MIDGLLLELGGVFTLLFVTLGPLKIIGPFVQQTRGADDSALRAIALHTFVLGLIGAVAGGFVGQALLRNWGIETNALLLAGGLVFLIVGLRLVLEQYEPAPTPPPALELKSPMAAALRITFPTVVTPYGIAALIVLFTKARDGARLEGILAIVVGILVLDLLAMLYARAIMGNGIVVMVLQLLGAVLGVLQVALAVQMIVIALRGLGVLSG